MKKYCIMKYAVQTEVSPAFWHVIFTSDSREEALKALDVMKLFPHTDYFFFEHIGHRSLANNHAEIVYAE